MIDTLNVKLLIYSIFSCKKLNKNTFFPKIGDPDANHPKFKLASLEFEDPDANHPKFELASLEFEDPDANHPKFKLRDPHRH